eukprot:2401044-Ditylum_brightwellii.AAC.1
MSMNVNFLYASNHREKNFSFYIPKYIHNSFAKYKKQLSNHGRFLRNWSDRAMASEQNIGVDCPRTFFSKNYYLH